MVAEASDPLFENRHLQARQLRELIVALDRRVPRAGHADEAEIARDAAVMRERAVNRLAEIAPPPFDTAPDSAR